MSRIDIYVYDNRPTPKSFWSYQSSEETPTLREAVETGAIAAGTTQQQWEQMSPGMRREIVRSKKKKSTDAGEKVIRKLRPQVHMMPGPGYNYTGGPGYVVNEVEELEDPVTKRTFMRVSQTHGPFRFQSEAKAKAASL